MIYIVSQSNKIVLPKTQRLNSEKILFAGDMIIEFFLTLQYTRTQ